MKSSPHLDVLLDVWNKLPSSEKRQYSNLTMINTNRKEKENTNPLQASNKTLVKKRSKARLR